MPDTMRRLLRILLNAATVVSLLLCVAVIVLWVRSYRSIEVVGRANVLPGQIQAGSGSPSLIPVQLFSVESGSGRILFDRSKVYLTAEGVDRVGGDGAWHFSTEPATAQWPYGLIPGVGGGTYWNTMGFGRRQQAWTGNVLNVPNLSQSVDDRWLPHWLLAVITAILPVRACARIVRHRRSQWHLQRGLCPGCGYDLRATPDRCPECGRATADPTPQAGNAG